MLSLRTLIDNRNIFMMLLISFLCLCPYGYPYVVDITRYHSQHCWHPLAARNSDKSSYKNAEKQAFQS